MGEEDDRETVAAQLRRIRETVRERALLEPVRLARPPATASRSQQGSVTEPLPEPAPPPLRPDGSAVNALWDVSQAPTGGLLGRWLRRALSPFVGAQVAWNSQQVQLDNAILGYVDARFDVTHRHYDRVLGIQGRHIQDANERHLILQEELVAHVHDLVHRIDLVLGEAEKGRLSLEAALRDVRNHLARVEERLNRG
ncbi:MAG: hypothetical protein ACHQNV_00025 [Vicinamibacteria bacterium]